ARIAQRRHDVLVAREDPEAERAVVDGVLGAQPAIHRIGIGNELRIDRVEMKLAHRWPPRGILTDHYTVSPGGDPGFLAGARPFPEREWPPAGGGRTIASERSSAGLAAGGHMGNLYEPPINQIVAGVLGLFAAAAVARSARLVARGLREERPLTLVRGIRV